MGIFSPKKDAHLIIYLVFIFFALMITACGGEATMDLILDGQSHYASESVPQMSLLSLLIVLILAMTAAVLASGRSS